jgi:hypothetical protein
MPSIYFVANFKGGVGKSLFAMILLDYLINANQDCIFVETDTNNPDVYKCYENIIPCEALDLDEASGWAELVNLCDENPKSIIVICSAARSNTGVKEFGGTLGSSLEELNRKLVAFWVIDDKKDSLESLADYLDYMPESLTHVVENRKFGKPERFHYFESSDIKETILANKGKVIELPILAPVITDYLYINRLAIEKVVDPETRISTDKRVPLGNKGLMINWRKKCYEILDEVI